MKERLDVMLVKRNLAESREKAKREKTRQAHRSRLTYLSRCGGIRCHM